MSDGDEQSTGSGAVISDEKLDRLITASEDVVEANGDLAKAMVAHQERARLARRRYRVTVALIVLGFSILWFRQEQALTNAQESRDRIVSCTDPTGTCYQEGQARTGALISQLIDTFIDATACAPAAPADATPAERKASIARCIITLRTEQK